MIEGKDPVLQAFLGTLMTWGLTALGAAMAFFIKGNQVRRYFMDISINTYLKWDISSRFHQKIPDRVFIFQRKLLDASLGFAGGVMLAASYWSLLEPAIEMAEKSKIYGEEGKLFRYRKPHLT